MADQASTAAGAIQQISNAVKQLLNQLPAQSRARRVLSASNPVDFWKNLFGSNPYTENQMVLGEKYMLYVLGIDIHDRHKVPDDMIEQARKFYTTLFDIYIDSSDDIDKLRQSPEAYMEYHKDRPDLWTESKVREASAILKALPANEEPGAWQQGLVSFANKLATQGRGLIDEQGLSLNVLSISALKKYAPLFAILLILGVIISIRLRLYKP